MKKRALFVGVDEYENLNPLGGAVADARAMRNFFRDRAEFVTEVSENPKFSQEIPERVEALRRGMEAGDLLLVYFAGHGAEINGTQRLLCTKANRLAVHRGDDSVTLTRLIDAARGQQDTVFIFDACRTDVILEGFEAIDELEKLKGKLAEQGISYSDVISGKVKLRGLLDSLFGRGGAKKRDLAFVDDGNYPQASPEQSGMAGEKAQGEVVVLFSCQSGTFSSEFDGHGLFTHALLDELGKAADAGIAVKVAEPFRERVNDRMSELARRRSLSIDQRAQIRFDRPVEILSGRSDSRDAPKVADVKTTPREQEAFTCGTARIPMRWCMPTTGGDWANAHGGNDWFEMGSPTDEPCRDWLAQEDRNMEENRHPVCISNGFWIGETAVTQGQWRAVMGTDVEALCAEAIADGTPYEWPGSDPARPQTFRDRKNKKLAGGAGPAALCYNEQDNAPVYFTNWNDAMEFCKRLTEAERRAGRLPRGFAYRLPTEAEWEYACRAGTVTTLPHGEPFLPDSRGMDASALDGIAWYAGNSFAGWEGKGEDPARYGRPQQRPTLRMAQRSVHGKAANVWGIKGMLGNVWEWCLDYAVRYPLTRQQDPCGPSDGRYHIVRGGCWYSDAFECRPAARWRHEAGFRNWSIGFRVVLAREVRP